MCIKMTCGVDKVRVNGLVGWMFTGHLARALQPACRHCDGVVRFTALNGLSTDYHNGCVAVIRGPRAPGGQARGGMRCGRGSRGEGTPPGSQQPSRALGRKRRRRRCPPPPRRETVAPPAIEQKGKPRGVRAMADSKGIHQSMSQGGQSHNAAAIARGRTVSITRRTFALASRRCAYLWPA